MNNPDSFYYPKFVNIEITNHCNIKCIICPHGHDLVDKKGYMSMEVFEAIIDQLDAAPYEKPIVSLFGIGESLLHPSFIDMASYGKSKGFFQRLTSNGFFLTPPKADEIIESDALDYIEISFDDSAEKYKTFKGGKIYDIVADNIEYFIDKNRSIQVLIKFLQYGMEDEFEIYNDIEKRFSRENVSLVACEVSSWRGTMSMDFLSEESVQKIFTKVRSEPLKKKCRNGADMGMFGWDGSLRSCYMDYNSESVFGNIRDKRLPDLLFCKERKAFIDNIVSGNHRENPICRDCLAPYNMDDKRIMVKSDSAESHSRGSHFQLMKQNNR